MELETQAGLEERARHPVGSQAEQAARIGKFRLDPGPGVRLDGSESSDSVHEWCGPFNWSMWPVWCLGRAPKQCKNAFDSRLRATAIELRSADSSNIEHPTSNIEHRISREVARSGARFQFSGLGFCRFGPGLGAGAGSFW